MEALETLVTSLNKAWFYVLETLYCESCRHYSVPTTIKWDENAGSWVLCGRGNLTVGSYKRLLTPEQALESVNGFKHTALTEKKWAETCRGGGMKILVWHGNDHIYREGFVCPDCKGVGYHGGGGKMKVTCRTCDGKKLLKEMPIPKSEAQERYEDDCADGVYDPEPIDYSGNY